MEEGEALYFTPPTQEHTQIEATSQLPTQIVDSSSQLNMTQSTQPPESRTIYAPVRDLSCAVGMTSLHNETNSANTTPRSQKSHRTTTPSPSTTPSTIKKVIVTQNKRPLPDTTTTNETETTQPRAKKAVTVLHDINGTFALRAQQQQEQAHQQQQSMLLFAQQMREDRLQQQQYQQMFMAQLQAQQQQTQTLMLWLMSRDGHAPPSTLFAQPAFPTSTPALAQAVVADAAASSISI